MCQWGPEPREGRAELDAAAPCGPFNWGNARVCRSGRSDDDGVDAAGGDGHGDD